MSIVGSKARNQSSASAAESYVEIQSMSVGYSGVGAVVRDVSFSIDRGEICVLVGPNGAGKTTFLHALSGVLPSEDVEPQAGIVRVGSDVLNHPYRPEAAFKAGIVLVPDRANVFGTMSVEENLAFSGRRRDAKDAAEVAEEIFDLFPKLHDLKARKAAFLSGGERQMLAIGSGLMADARILLLDEVSTGVAPVLVKSLLEGVTKIREAHDLTIIMAEQVIGSALEISDWCLGLHAGDVAYLGRSDQVDVNELYGTLFVGQRTGDS